MKIKVEEQRNYSMIIFSNTDAGQLSLTPTYYDWVVNDDIIELELLEWIKNIFKKHNINSFKIGVKLLSCKAFIDIDKKSATVYYHANNSDIYDEPFDSKHIDFKDYHIDMDTCEDSNEDEDFWDNPEGMVNKLKTEIKKCKASNLHILIQNELSKRKLDYEKIITYLQEYEDIDSYTINMLLLYIKNNAIYREKSYWEINKIIKQKHKTLFDVVFEEDIVEKKINDFSHVLLLFGSFTFNPVFTSLYYLILFKLIDNYEYKNNQDNVLETLQLYYDDKKFNNILLKEYISLMKNNSEYKFSILLRLSFIFAKTEFTERFVNGLLDSMIQHIENKRYLSLDYTQLCFYNFIPYRSTYFDEFSRYDFIDLDIQIFNIVKRELATAERSEVLQNLWSKRKLSMIILNELNTTKNTKHIMNLFFKDYGKEELFKFITEKLSHMYEHATSPSFQIDNWKNFKQVLRNKII